jgi:hypothetical protein
MVTSTYMLAGGCHCGAVRYECAAPVSKPTICHCTSCRRTSGAHSVAWISVKRTAFKLLRGTPREYASSEKVVRSFCEQCGCSLTYAHTKYPDEFDLTIASFDDPSAIAPTDHIWMSDAASWDRPGDGLPQHAGWRNAP